jgi:hypothetical protein
MSKRREGGEREYFAALPFVSKILSSSLVPLLPALRPFTMTLNSDPASSYHDTQLRSLCKQFRGYGELLFSYCNVLFIEKFLISS